MARGEIENISLEPVLIKSLGWLLPVGYTESVDEDSMSDFRMLVATDEIVQLITDDKIEVRTETGLAVETTQQYQDWVGTAAVTGPQQHVLTLTIDQRVPTSGERWFQWNTSVSLLEVRWPINATFTILRINLGVELADDTNSYGVKMYHGSDLTNHVFASGQVLYPGQRAQGRNYPLSNPQQFDAGTYAFAAYRVLGSGGSDFTKMIMNMFYLRED